MLARSLLRDGIMVDSGRVFLPRQSQENSRILWGSTGTIEKGAPESAPPSPALAKLPSGGKIDPSH